MCGIAGFISKTEIAEQTLVDMAHSIHHRGPDHTGFLREPGLGLTMTRLSIIDLAGGNQPVHSEDGDVSLIFNGEIYNFKALREELEKHITFHTHSDTEVILHGYTVWGNEIFAKLNGMFALAIWDRRLQKVLLVRDPLGVKPLYYLQGSESLYFSSEIKTFTHLRLANKINPLALSQFLCADYVFHPQTAIEGVLQVLPGQVMEIDRDLKTSDWIFRTPGRSNDNVPRQISRVEDMRDQLDKAIIGQTVADVPYGLLLSSGVDSMAILGALHRHGLTDSLCTYTAYYPDTPSFSEDAPVRKLAERWGFKNKLIPITAQDVIEHWDQLCNTFDNLDMLPTSIAIFLASKVASRERRVLLSGNGGDELFFGYPTYRATRWAERLHGIAGLINLAKPLARLIPPTEDYLTTSEKGRRFLDGFNKDPALAHVQWRHVFRFEETHALLSGACQINNRETLYSDQLRHIADGRRLGFTDGAEYAWCDMRTWMVDSGLMMWDKAGMSASVEIRVPFIDPDFVDYVLNLPLDVRTGGKPGTKALLRQVVADDVPQDILTLPKSGFQVPIATWLHGELHEMFRDLTSSLPSEIFNHRVIDNMWREFDARKADNALKLWTLGAVAGWAKAHHVDWH
jgi:asparagine synthase (glutamine-hydrolysing)